MHKLIKFKQIMTLGACLISSGAFANEVIATAKGKEIEVHSEFNLSPLRFYGTATNRLEFFSKGYKVAEENVDSSEAYKRESYLQGILGQHPDDTVKIVKDDKDKISLIVE